jgi:recombinational DNA repair protein (RecF pathway)
VGILTKNFLNMLALTGLHPGIDYCERCFQEQDIVNCLIKRGIRSRCCQRFDSSHRASLAALPAGA